MSYKFRTRTTLISIATLLATACQITTEAQTAAQTSEAAAPATPTQPCQFEAYRQMDFWVGDWELTWSNPDGKKAKGTNIITKDALGDCVITENFNGAPGNTLVGTSMSTYSAPHKIWRQTWVDNQGGYFALTGGPQANGTFILEMERLNNKGSHSRMVFEDIEADSLVWRWQGKKAETDDWGDQWVIQYKRK